MHIKYVIFNNQNDFAPYLENFVELFILVSPSLNLSQVESYLLNTFKDTRGKIIGAFIKNRLVGMYAVTSAQYTNINDIFVELKINPSSLVSVSLKVHYKYRNKSIATNMIKILYSEYDSVTQIYEWTNIDNEIMLNIWKKFNRIVLPVQLLLFDKQQYLSARFPA